MTELVSASYGGVWYHVKNDGLGSWSIAKRQGERTFAEYAVHKKVMRDMTWLECDTDLCPSARYRGATSCKHVKIALTHIETGEDESAVKWTKE